MTPLEAAERMDELVRYVREELPRQTARVFAGDLAALVTTRVVNTGVDFEGVSFSPYSSTPIPAYRFWGKARTQSAEKLVRSLSREKKSLSYATFRAINNLKSDTKNFEFTSEMWRKLGVVSVEVANDRFRVSIGGTTKASQEKIDANSEREGRSIIEASEREAKVVQNSAAVWLDNAANRILTP